MTGKLDLTMRIMFTALLFLPLISGVILKKLGKLDDDKLCALIILTGIFLRVIYIFHTKITIRQHDVGDFDPDGGGHSGYILYLLYNRRLPDFDPRYVDQFYHPPLHHIICALWLKFLKLFGADTSQSVFETIQALTLGYSSMFCLLAYKSMKRLRLESSGLIMGTALVTFHPTLIILSGSINNDMLSGLLGMAAVYFTIKWSQDKKRLSIIAIALSFGLGMMTKLSVVLLAPAVAAVFLIVMIKNKDSLKKYILQFFVFGIISVPIGLFWVIRNYIKFGVPINYVPLLPDTAAQYIDVPPLKRLTDLSLYQLSSPYTQWVPDGSKYNEFNPVIALFKNAMFDEGTYFRKCPNLQSCCSVLFFCNIIVSILSVIALVMIWVKFSKLNIEHKLLITGVSAVIFLSYIAFCLKFPHVCTQNMRYCIPLIFTSAVVCGMFVGRDDLSGKFFTSCQKALKKSTAAFCLLSTIMFVSLAFYYRPR